MDKDQAFNPSLACAELAHEANRIYCAAIGDTSQKPWSEAEPWQRESAINGVRVALAGATPEQQHAAWSADKIAAGWRHGPTKDTDAKTHPCLVPYNQLPPAQRAKDALFGAVVRSMHAALFSHPDAPPSRPPHPATTAILRFFASDHLPEKLRGISAPFGELARDLASRLDGAELTVALRKLLEAKDAAVRAAIDLP